MVEGSSTGSDNLTDLSVEQVNNPPSVLTLATGAECELSCAMVEGSSTGSDNLTELSVEQVNNRPSVLTLATGAECELSCAMVWYKVLV